MTFQANVFTKQGFGVQGELNNNVAVTSQSFILQSVSAANNVFGRAFSVLSQGVARAGNSGSLPFAGILANPKQNASFGGSTGPLSPTLTLPNYSQVDLVTAGVLTVTLPAAAAIGDVVIYDNTTGALSTLPVGSALPVGKSNAYATVYQYSLTEAGLATILLAPSAPVLIPEIVIAEGSFVWSGSGASATHTVPGALTTDTVISQIQSAPTQAANWVSGKITSANTLTVVISAANTSNDAIISYRITRPAS